MCIRLVINKNMLVCFRKTAKSSYQLRSIVCPSVRPSTWNNTSPTAEIFMKFDICTFLGNMSRKIKVELQPNNNGYFTYRPNYINDLISLNSSQNEKCPIKKLEKIKTHILCSVTFFPPENCAIYGIILKNKVERGRPQMTV